jgi:thiamine-phosphate diphosphorylase
MIRLASDLCLILDPSLMPGNDPVPAAEAVLAAGVRFIQYRDKRGSRRTAYGTALALVERVRKYRAVLTINDDVDLAMAVDADGVHLGQEDLPVSAARSLLGPGRIIGASAHTPDQARIAEEDGADYIGVGPIFSSPSKQARPPLGCEMLRSFKKAVQIPVFAIGGISEKNVAQVFETGADGVACISAVFGSPEPGKAAEALLRAIRRVRPAERT